MNKLAIAVLLISGAPLASADYRVTNADGSELSELCVAAAASKDALQDSATALGLDNSDLETVRCNGLDLRRFVARYGNAEKEMSVGYILKKSDDSPVTELCVAAASSSQEFEKVKAMHFTGEDNVEAEVMCNGMPLRTFARRFRAADMSISLR